MDVPINADLRVANTDIRTFLHPARQIPLTARRPTPATKTLKNATAYFRSLGQL
jgi:hypothetical protein